MHFKSNNHFGLLLAKIHRTPQLFRFLNKGVLVLIGLFFFLRPFPHITSIELICFYVSIFMTIILILYRKVEFSLKSPLAIPFGSFILWTILSSLFALDSKNTLHDIYAHLISYVIIYYIVINFFCSKKYFSAIIWIKIISLGLISFGCIIYFYIIKENPATLRLGVPQVNIPVNSIGLITAPLIFLQLFKFGEENKIYLKIILLFFIATSSLALLLSGTNGAVIGLIFPSLIILPTNRKKILIFILVIIIALALLPYNNTSLNRLKNKLKDKVRLKIWYTYYHIIKDHPITGTGFGMQIYDKNMVEKYNAKLPPQYRLNHPFHPHNMIVDITIRTGIVGLILFLYIIASSLWVTIKTAKNTEDHFIKKWALCIIAVFTSILIQSMFTDMLLGKQAYLFYLTLSLMTILWRLDAEALN